jgi:electron transfer flavoprotein alpha subunit
MGPHGPGRERAVIGVVPARAGTLAAGGAETVAECGGRALVVGPGAAAAAQELRGVAFLARVWERPSFAPGAWAAGLAEVLGHEPVIVLPASADGRDLAPRLAAELGRPFHAGALSVHRHGGLVTRFNGRALEEVHTSGPFVATLLPGVRSITPEPDVPLAVVPLAPEPSAKRTTPPDVVVIEELEPDVATMDLVEAPRIVAAGAGLDGPELFERLAQVAAALGAAVGATRVVTDRGWLPHDRQIGTTGVVVHPRLYLAFAISGAVQHTSGLGTPDHIVSVNTDPYCPMMEMADLALVSDANAVIGALAARLALSADPPKSNVIAFPVPVGGAAHG